MQSSPYAKIVPSILAEMEHERQEDDNQQQPPDQDTETEQEQVVYVYRTSEGGMLLSPTKIGEQGKHKNQNPPPLTVQRQRQTPALGPDAIPQYFCIFFCFSFCSRR